MRECRVRNSGFCPQVKRPERGVNTHSHLDGRVDLWAFIACSRVNFTYSGFFFSCNSVSSWNNHFLLTSFLTTTRAEQLYSVWTTTVRRGARTVPHSVPGRSLRNAFVTELLRIQPCSRTLPLISDTLFKQRKPQECATHEYWTEYTTPKQLGS